LSLATSEKDRERSLLAETAGSLDGVENDVALKLDLGVVGRLGLESC
jgi:hypothetical protein